MRMLARMLWATMAAATTLPAMAATPISQTRPLDARGRVEIENLKGKVEVVAWDRPEVRLSGTTREHHFDSLDCHFSTDFVADFILVTKIIVSELDHVGDLGPDL